MAGMVRMGRRCTSQGEKGELRRNHGATDLRNYGFTRIFFISHRNLAGCLLKKTKKTLLPACKCFQPFVM